MKKMILQLNNIDYNGSIVDGPGIRTVLYVQGCDKRCKGCHNPSTWEINAGESIEISKLVKELKSKVKNRKLTISGGEPLLQYDAILELVKLLPEFNIVLYTGKNIEEVPKEILKYIDYIKVGEYIEKLRTTTNEYVGSTNQKFLKLK